MRILLVITRQARMSTYQLPVGIGMISSCLKRAGHEVRVLNPNHSTLDLEMLVSGAIREFEPELLAIGGMSFHVSQIREAVDIARPLLPDQPIVLGGVCVSYQPEVAMRAIPGADYGVAGEGEYTIVELVQALEDGTDPGKVSGIIYRGEDGEYKQTLPRSFEKNLDELPWVDWEGVGLDVYAGVHKPGDGPPGLILDTSTRLMPFMASRGCPYKCTFCCHELSEGTYRSRSLDDCFAEIQYGMEEFGINALMIYDDVFCLKPARMHEFCERIQPLNLRWQVALRAEQVTADNLKMLEDAGCVTVGFGVESMSQPVLDSMRKGTNKEELVVALDIIYKSKITNWSSLIFGDPAERVETGKESLEWWAANNRFDLRTAFISFQPGSRIYEDALKSGLINDPVEFLLSGNLEINGTSMSDEEYEFFKTTTVPQYSTSFGFPARILRLINKGDGKGSHFELTCVCSHCEEELQYDGISLAPNLLNRIYCKHCQRIFVVPIRFRDRLSPELEQLHEKLQALMPMRSDNPSPEIISKIFSLCLQIGEIDGGDDEIWKIILEIIDDMEKPRDAVDVLKWAIMSNPYDPELFDQMNVRLTALGEDEERQKYVRQAALLRRLGVTEPFDIDMMKS